MSWNAIPKRCGRVKRRRAPHLKDRFDGPVIPSRRRFITLPGATLYDLEHRRIVNHGEGVKFISS